LIVKIRPQLAGVEAMRNLQLSECDDSQSRNPPKIISRYTLPWAVALFLLVAPSPDAQDLAEMSAGFIAAFK
jgi:hypothetical protein